MGPQMCLLLATLCVASSLALFALGYSDLTGGFCLRTLSCHRPTTIVGPILDTIVVSHDVEGTSCEELGWHINLCLLHLFTVPVWARHFASSVVKPQGYKTGGHPCTQPTSSHMSSHHLNASFPMAKKKER
jgi:hypothetical protein